MGLANGVRRTPDAMLYALAKFIYSLAPARESESGQRSFASRRSRLRSRRLCPLPRTAALHKQSPDARRDRSQPHHAHAQSYRTLPRPEPAHGSGSRPPCCTTNQSAASKSSSTRRASTPPSAPRTGSPAPLPTPSPAPASAWSCRRRSRRADRLPAHAVMWGGRPRPLRTPVSGLAIYRMWWRSSRTTCSKRRITARESDTGCAARSRA